jgi:hypothetical protein
VLREKTIMIMISSGEIIKVVTGAGTRTICKAVTETTVATTGVAALGGVVVQVPQLDVLETRVGAAVVAMTLGIEAAEGHAVRAWKVSGKMS